MSAAELRVWVERFARAGTLLSDSEDERLLLNILPRVITDRLKVSNGIIADGFEEVTVLLGRRDGAAPAAATASSELSD